MIKRYKGLLVDLDGTIYFKGKLIKDAIGFLEGLKRKGIVIRYLTNTNGTPPAKIIERLRDIGLHIEDEQFFNPTKVAKAYSSKNKSLSCYVMASDEIKANSRDGHWDEKKPDCVLLGALEEVCNYDEINKVKGFIANGSQLISTSYWPYYYAKSGERKIDTGSFTRSPSQVSGSRRNWLENLLVSSIKWFLGLGHRFGQTGKKKLLIGGRHLKMAA